MKFLIDRLAFRDALQKVEMAIGRKPTRPVLGGVLIEAKNDQVVLMATDLDISIRYTCHQVQVDSPGWTVLPGRELVEVVKDTESETITLSQENKLPIIVFDMNKRGNLLKVVSGENIGTEVNL